ncbi:MAG: hypothetical protein AB1Z98_08090 [Nannocystaceae bacterium]
MTENKNFKRRVRARMAKTGESYTAARAQLTKTAAVAPVGPSPEQYASLAGMSDEAVERKTGRDWKGWVQQLDALGAAELSHREIAAAVGKRWPEIGGWWAQTVTVGYERVRGLRATGQQRADGSFVANKSRTYGVPASTLYRAFSQKRVRQRWLDVAAVVRSSTIDTSVRFDWPDGTGVTAYFTAKGPNKSAVAIQHGKLASDEHRERAKQDWGQRLDALRAVLL